MSEEGFATLISDDLPGFNSLSGSGFFDQVGDWNLMDESNPANNDESNNSNEEGFDQNDEEDCFEVVRRAKPSTNKDSYFVFSGDEDECDDDDEDFVLTKEAQAATAAAAPRSSSTSSRRRSDRPKSGGERKYRTTAEGGKRRQTLRRSKTVNDGADDTIKTGAGSTASSSSSRGSLRRIKTADGNARKMSEMRRPKRSENLKKKGLDLGAKLTKLEKDESEVSIQGGRRMRRRSSNKDLLGSVAAPTGAPGDEVSVVSRGVQSCSAGSVGRRNSRRRRASQTHDLLARQLQTKAATEAAAASGKEEVWKARARRRSVEALSLNQSTSPAIAA